MSRAGNRAGEIYGPTAPNPISPQSGLSWLYVPRANIVIPQGLPGETYYYLSENGIDRFISENDVDLLVQEG